MDLNYELNSVSQARDKTDQAAKRTRIAQTHHQGDFRRCRAPARLPLHGIASYCHTNKARPQLKAGGEKIDGSKTSFARTHPCARRPRSAAVIWERVKLPHCIAFTRRTLLASTVLIPAGAAFASKNLYRDASAPIEARVRDLLSRMTLEEKVAQMRCIWIGKAGLVNQQANFDPERARPALGNGIGQIARPGEGIRGTANAPRFLSIEATIAFVNEVQRFLVEQTRLGIPALFHEEAAHGYMAKSATVFPIPPALGSTWDPELVEHVFTVAAREARARGATVALCPIIDLMREPRYGRAEEFFGEDPFHVAQMGIAAVRGLQGRTRPLARDRVFSTLKHFVHGSPQGGLNIAPAEMSERTLRENYLVPFAEVIKSADPAIVMPSYNEVEGVPAHASVELLRRTGREQLGFHGAYFSDYGGVMNLVSHHHVAEDRDGAAVLAVNAGVDAELPDSLCYEQLPTLVASGRVLESMIDASVARILALKFEAGLFEDPYSDLQSAVRDTGRPADRRLAQTAAEKALVLLKNDGILPLNPRGALKLAVIGPNAATPMLGGYSGEPDMPIDILAGVRATAGPSISIEHADGVWITQPRDPRTPRSIIDVPEADNSERIDEAVQVAQRSDIVLLVVGDNEVITQEAVANNFPGDRNSLALYGQQDALVEALLATGKPIIALLLNGRPLSVTRLADRAGALLEGWYLGQEAGSAFANVLFGRVNPGGKLTVSIPRSVGELPAYYNRHPSADVNRYVEGRRAPLFPFGHGLSYTQFDISTPRLARDHIGVGDNFRVHVDVVNVGARAGDEVVQLYIRDNVSSAPRPILELKAFQRVTLNPGQRRTVDFDLTPDALAFWNIDMEWVVEPGTFTISAGSSSASLKAAMLTVV